MEGRECNVCHRHYKNAGSLASHKYNVHNTHEKFNTPATPGIDTPAAPAASAMPEPATQAQVTPPTPAETPAAPASAAAPVTEEKMEVETHETFKTDLPPLPDMGNAAPAAMIDVDVYNCL